MKLCTRLSISPCISCILCLLLVLHIYLLFAECNSELLRTAYRRILGIKWELDGLYEGTLLNREKRDLYETVQKYSPQNSIQTGRSDYNWCEDITNITDYCPNGTTKQVPSVVGIGIMKSGTTALDWFISLHPDIIVQGRETYYFGIMKSREMYEFARDSYCKLLPCLHHPPTSLVVDRTPFYYTYPLAIPHIHASNPNTKLLLIVRDPVERVVSQLVHSRGDKPWEELREFVLATSPEGKTVVNKKAGSYITLSQYGDHINNWLQYFTINKTLLVIHHRTFRYDLYGTLLRIERFLGLEHKLTPDMVMYSERKKFPCKKFPHKRGRAECMGSRNGNHHPEVDPHDYRILKEHYRNSSEVFFKAIGQDFGWNDYFKSEEHTAET